MKKIKVVFDKSENWKTGFSRQNLTKKFNQRAVAKFIVPGGRDKVNSGIGLLYWPVSPRLHRLAGR
jgi:hypothetical protein